MRTAVFALAAALALASQSIGGQTPQRQPDFDRMLQQQAETDKTWRAASAGFMQMENSWNRVWTFLDWNLDPFHAESTTSTK